MAKPRQTPRLVPALPEAPEGSVRALEDEALELLLRVVRSPPDARSGVTAAARLLEYTRWRDEQGDPLKLLEQLLGDERKLLTWMRAAIQTLEAKLMASTGHGDGEDV